MSQKFKSLNFLLFLGFVVTAILSQKYLDQEMARIVIFSYAGFMVLVLLIKRRIRRARNKQAEQNQDTTAKYDPNARYDSSARYDTSSLWRRSDEPKDEP